MAKRFTITTGPKRFKPCTEYARRVTDGMPRHMGLTLAEKLKAGAKHGFKPGSGWRPKIGQTLVTDEKNAYGHVVVVNHVKGDHVRLSESNYAEHNAVTHNRLLNKRDPRIKYVLPTTTKKPRGV